MPQCLLSNVSLLPFRINRSCLIAGILLGFGLMLPSALLSSAAATEPSDSPQVLPVDGRRIHSRASPNQPRTMTLTLAQPGLLTLVAEPANADTDLSLVLLDEEGVPVPGGYIDEDLEDKQGREWGVVQIPAAGTYQVRVHLFGFSDTQSQFSLSASWIALPSLGITRDPGDRPSQARELPIGQVIYDRIRPSRNERRRWFVIEAPTEGHLAALTDAEEGDLILEAFAEGLFEQPVTTSDQDLWGNRAAESALIPVQAGKRIYLRVSSYQDEACDFRILAQWLPR